MSSIAQTIQNVTEKIQTGNIMDLKQGLRQIATLSKSQLEANESSINYPVQQMTQAIQRNLKVNQDQITPEVRALIKNAAQNLPPRIKRQVGATITDLQRQVSKKSEQNRIQNLVNKQTQKIQQQIVNQAIVAKDIRNITLKPMVQSVTAVNKSSIQQSVQMFSPLLNNVSIPKVVRPSQLPQTMKLLTRYVGIMGATPIGTVTNQSGVSYVGTRTVDRGNGITQIIPFQKNVIAKTTIPSIPMQLQYYANKTVNSWNKYINDESQFVNFLSKVNTQSDRQQYVQKQFKTLNINTFSAQIIASLAHYYIYIPLQKMAGKININSNIEPTIDGFYQSYQVGNTPSTNPLLLGIKEGKQLVKQMFLKKNTPAKYLDHILEWLTKNVSYGLNKDVIQQMKKVFQLKVQQARNFMHINGLDPVLTQQVLESTDWSSVKKKRFLIMQGILNTQLSQMARKIAQQSKKAQVQQVQFTWGSQEILSHDYIWGWQNRYNY